MGVETGRQPGGIPLAQLADDGLMLGMGFNRLRRAGLAHLHVEAQRHRQHPVHADQHRVARRLHHGHVKVVVVPCGFRNGHGPAHALVGLGHLVEMAVRYANRGQGRCAGFHDAAEIEHVFQRLGGIVEMLGKDGEDRIEVRLAHLCAAPRLLDEAEGFQMDHGLAHRVARDAKAFGQIPLVRQQIPDLHALHDLPAQNLANVLDC